MVSLTTATTALNPKQEMTDYKKYSLENLENWLNDAISSGDATPQEIYDVIVGVVRESHDYHKEQADQSDELLRLLNGDNTLHLNFDDIFSCDANDPSTECKVAWNSFWEDKPEEYNIREAEYYNSVSPSATQKDIDKVVKWQLPVQVDGLTGDCFINIPDDLLKVAELKEGDTVEWIDRNDSSFEMRKVNGTV